MPIPIQPTTWDPSQIVITLGPYIISGYADGSYVKVSRNSDTFKTTVGAGGDVARTRSADKSGSIEIDLMQTSASNDVLSAQAILDENKGGGALPLGVKDLSGRSLATAKNAWVRKLPDLEYGKDMGTRKWVLDCDKLIFTVGGN